MKKIKWGVMGTAFICERSTFPGMLQAENCEMYAIAGRSMEKAEQFEEVLLVQGLCNLLTLAIRLLSAGAQLRNC